jgi:hypothetical protein
LLANLRDRLRKGLAGMSTLSFVLFASDAEKSFKTLTRKLNLFPSSLMFKQIDLFVQGILAEGKAQYS